MPRYLLSPLAQDDLDGIWDYSAGRWGHTRANRYALDIRSAIEMLASNPKRGRTFEPSLPHHLKYAVGNHMIFFRIADDGIVVIRVLHQSMDFERHLRDTE